MSLKTIKTKVHTVTHKALPCRSFAPLGKCLVVIFYSIFFLHVGDLSVSVLLSLWFHLFEVETDGKKKLWPVNLYLFKVLQLKI